MTRSTWIMVTVSVVLVAAVLVLHLWLAVHQVVPQMRSGL